MSLSNFGQIEALRKGRMQEKKRQAKGLTMPGTNSCTAGLEFEEINQQGRKQVRLLQMHGVGTTRYDRKAGGRYL